MHRTDFRSLYVLMKIGHDLQAELADTFIDDLTPAFGSLLQALKATNQTLQLSDEYRWVSNAGLFDAARDLFTPSEASRGAHPKAA